MLKSRAYSLFLKYVFNSMLLEEFGGKKKHVEFRDCCLSFAAGCSVFTAGGSGPYFLFCVE